MRSIPQENGQTNGVEQFLVGVCESAGAISHGKNDGIAQLLEAKA
jgi:hypothetical protein